MGGSIRPWVTTTLVVQVVVVVIVLLLLLYLHSRGTQTSIRHARGMQGLLYTRIFGIVNEHDVLEAGRLSGRRQYIVQNQRPQFEPIFRYTVVRQAPSSSWWWWRRRRPIDFTGSPRGRFKRTRRRRTYRDAQVGSQHEHFGSGQPILQAGDGKQIGQ